MLQENFHCVGPLRLVRREEMVLVMASGAPDSRERRTSIRRPGFAFGLLLRARQAVRPVLDGLGRLGIAPWALFELAAYAGEFLLHRMAGLWRRQDKCPGEVRVLWVLRITEIEITAVQAAESRPPAYLLPPIDITAGSGRSAC